jgi:Asp-tRNA(Asn)/Glu-tRNA(Gln) amidotransferase C subunit
MTNNTTDKRYRVIKEIITYNPVCNNRCKIGTESIKEGIYYYFPYLGKEYAKEKMGNSFMCSNPQDYPDWFELVVDEPKGKRIDVRFIAIDQIKLTDGFFYRQVFHTSVHLNEEQKEAIKKAIESIINDEQPSTDVSDKGMEYYFDSKKINERIAQLEEIEKAFNAAREVETKGIPVLIYRYDSSNIEEHFGNKYRTFKDYMMHNH